MRFIYNTLVFSCLTLQCHSAVGKFGSQTNSMEAVVPGDSTKLPNAIIEPIPGIGPNNVSKMTTVIDAQEGTISFEIYFGGSACRSLHYEFEKRKTDSLIIRQVGQSYMRVLTGFGIKGMIRNLEQGKYRIIVMTGAEGINPYSMFEREVYVP
jgi:hypothetical protein